MEYIKEENFKGTFKGKVTALYTLKNKNGFVTQITNFGGKIISLYVPDRKGNFTDIVLDTIILMIVLKVIHISGQFAVDVLTELLTGSLLLMGIHTNCR